MLYDILSLKNDVNVPGCLQKRISKKNLMREKIFFCCWRLEGHRRKEQDPEPDLLVKGTDPRIGIRIRIRIRIKMSWIRNTSLGEYPFEPLSKLRGRRRVQPS